METKFKLCPSCDFFCNVKENKYYCPKCGQRLIEACPNCGTPIDFPYAQFCSHCGHPLREQENKLKRIY